MGFQIFAMLDTRYKTQVVLRVYKNSIDEDTLEYRRAYEIRLVYVLTPKESMLDVLHEAISDAVTHTSKLDREGLHLILFENVWLPEVAEIASQLSVRSHLSENEPIDINICSYETYYTMRKLAKAEMLVKAKELAKKGMFYNET